MATSAGNPPNATDEHSLSYLRRQTPYKHWRDQPPPDLLTFDSIVTLMHVDWSRPLLSLNAVDNHGVQQQVMLDAAYILAGNRAGFLSLKPDGQQAIDKRQILLRVGQYYYNAFNDDAVQGFESAWTVMSSFQDWKFPHHEFLTLASALVTEGQEGSLLGHWKSFGITYQDRAARLRASTRFEVRSTNMSLVVKARDDNKCVLSAYSGTSSLDNAHLLPASLDGPDGWFARNRMITYCLRPSATRTRQTQDPTNGITLRVDIHRALDASSWIIFPVPSLQLYAAFFYWAEDEPAIADVGHAVPLMLDQSTSEAFLFARFAWCVFERLDRSGMPLRQAQPAQADASVVKHPRTSSEDSLPSSDMVGTPSGSRANDQDAKRSRPDPSDTAGLPEAVQEAERFANIVWAYTDTHSAFEAIGDPASISTSASQWRKLLDPDEVDQYDT